MFSPIVLDPADLATVIATTRRHLAEGTDTERRDAVAVLYGTLGLRIQEILNLRCSDVSAADATAKVATLKGGRPRVIPLDRTLLAASLEISSGRPIESPLIATRTGGKVDQRNLRRRWHAWCTEALGRAIRFHDLRHTMANHVYAKTSDIYTVQRMLGHRKIETTHLYLVSLRDIAPSMPGAD